MRRPATAATLSFGRVRQLALIAMGWTIIVLGVLLTPLPGPGGLPVALVGGMILMRNSPSSRRLFVRMKRRHPRVFRPVERVRDYLRERRQRRTG